MKRVCSIAFLNRYRALNVIISHLGVSGFRVPFEVVV